MNVGQPASLGRPRSSGGSIGSAEAASALSSPSRSKARPGKRPSNSTQLDSSGSDDDTLEGRASKRRQPGVKRACNECRQQKLKCDVNTEPTYQPCERCRRLKLTCRIDSNFRRIGKRSEKAQMEKEIQVLRAQLVSFSQQSSPATPHIKQDLDSGEAIASLMDLANGAEAGTFMRSPNAQLLFSRRLGPVLLNQDQVQDLFQIYFSFYHPFVPLLDPAKPPDEYYEASKLLFWSIISVAARRYSHDISLFNSLSEPVTKLLWQCISEVPQSYNVVKALCLLCSWPFPVSSTSLDPTFNLCSLAVSISMQLGLHRPSHIQDFSKFKIELREEELRDRARTWAACNAVAQRVSTGYGQVPLTLYDWTLSPTGDIDPGLILPKEVGHRLAIERFNNHVTEVLYMDKTDPVGLVSSPHRSTLTKFLTHEYKELEESLRDADPFAIVHLKAAGLHLRLSTFFDSPASSEYLIDLLSLFDASTSFLEYTLNLSNPSGSMLTYSTNYILQMTIAAAFSLLKLLNSFFAGYIDQAYGKSLFTRAVWAIRSISVRENDLPSRFAEVLAQFWKASGAGSKSQVQPSATSKNNSNSNSVPGIDDSLQLKVRCRMSMSLVYDSAWRWREELQKQGGRWDLEAAVKNPTVPDSTGESSSNSVTGDPQNSSLGASTATPLTTNTLISNANAGLGSSLGPGIAGLRDTGPAPTPPSVAANAGAVTADMMFGEAYSNEVFDPLSWIFDGDLPLMPHSLDDLRT